MLIRLFIILSLIITSFVLNAVEKHVTEKVIEVNSPGINKGLPTYMNYIKLESGRIYGLIGALSDPPLDWSPGNQIEVTVPPDSSASDAAPPIVTLINKTKNSLREAMLLKHPQSKFLDSIIAEISVNSDSVVIKLDDGRTYVIHNVQSFLNEQWNTQDVVEEDNFVKLSPEGQPIVNLINLSKNSSLEGILIVNQK